MKTNKLSLLKDVVIVDNAATIRSLNENETIDRQFQLHNLLNRFFIKRSLRNLSI